MLTKQRCRVAASKQSVLQAIFTLTNSSRLLATIYNLSSSSSGVSTSTNCSNYFCSFNTTSATTHHQHGCHCRQKICQVFTTAKGHSCETSKNNNNHCHYHHHQQQQQRYITTEIKCNEHRSMKEILCHRGCEKQIK